jgi:glycosyltransferase involved in cell wall biosynthesis
MGDALFVNKSMTPFPLGFPTLWRILRMQKIDVMHIQEPGSLGVTALLLSKFFRVPVVGAQHFSWIQIEKVAPPLLRWISVPFMKWYVRIIYGGFAAIMVPTKTASRDLSAIIGRENQIYPISNGVDTDIYVPRKVSLSRLRIKYKLPVDGSVFLYIGRLDADKNIETILRSLPQVKQKIHMVIAGVGKQKERLLNLSRELGITNITWIGEVQKQAIIDLYQLADVFVIMSPVETQSIVALQAISCGLPLVAANAGALPELVDGTNGFLVDANDDKTLATYLDRLAASPALRKRMGQRSRVIGLTHHKPRVLAKLEALYQQVIA